MQLFEREPSNRPGVRQVPQGSGEQGKLEKTGCKIICGAPTTLAVKGLMMMMMMNLLARECDSLDLFAFVMGVSQPGLKIVFKKAK